MKHYPLVSIVIPLYKSKKFLQTIINNIAAINYPNTEIIISDRHGLDNTIDLLKKRYANDPRMIFILENDQINWLEHTNLLFRLAKGKYIRWISHDDIIPDFNLPTMVDYLESHPDVVLCHGARIVTDLYGRLNPNIQYLDGNFPITNDDKWDFELTLNLYFLGYCTDFTGLFRKDILDQYGLYLRPTKRLIDAERLWYFGMSLVGKFYFFPTPIIKRLWPHSLTTAWQRRISDFFSNLSVMISYLNDFCPSSKKVLYGTFYLFVLTLLHIGEAKKLKTCIKLKNKLFKKVKAKHVSFPFKMQSLHNINLEDININVIAYPHSIIARQDFIIKINIQNQSNYYLASYDPHPIYIAYHWLDEAKKECVTFDGRRTRILPYLKPGSDREFLVYIEAPNISGNYCLRISLVQEGIFWFDDIRLQKPLMKDLFIEVENENILNFDYLYAQKSQRETAEISI